MNQAVQRAKRPIGDTTTLLQMARVPSWARSGRASTSCSTAWRSSGGFRNPSPGTARGSPSPPGWPSGEWPRTSWPKARRSHRTRRTRPGECSRSGQCAYCATAPSRPRPHPLLVVYAVCMSWPGKPHDQLGVVAIVASSLRTLHNSYDGDGGVQHPARAAIGGG
jgi:hypothetical protein